MRDMTRASHSPFFRDQFRVFCLTAALCASAAGAEPAATPAGSTGTGSGTAATVAPTALAPAPFLGLSVDPGSAFDPSQGLTVTDVVQGSTSDHLGVRVDDHILAAQGRPLASVADFATVAQALKVGDTLTFSLNRGGTPLIVTGPVERLARPRELTQQTAQLAEEVAELRALAMAHVHPVPASSTTIEQLLMLLKQVEADLPKAASDFRAAYPNGEFNLSIHLDIRSDRSATSPSLVVAPDLPGTASATAASATAGVPVGH